MLEKRANSNVSVDKRLRWPISHLSLQILIIWICTNLWHCQKRWKTHVFTVWCQMSDSLNDKMIQQILNLSCTLETAQLSVDLIWTISALWILNCSFNILKIQKRKTPLPDLTLFKNSKSVFRNPELQSGNCRLVICWYWDVYYTVISLLLWP